MHKNLENPGSLDFQQIRWNMQSCLDLAREGQKKGEVPIGAMVVDPDGKIISKAYNSKESIFNPCGHAEVNALAMAGEKLKSWRLTHCTLYVTLEPCPMCLGAMIQARIKGLVFGAYDKKGGGLSMGLDFYSSGRLNHRFEVMGGIEHYACSQLLSTFFKERRKAYKK